VKKFLAIIFTILILISITPAQSMSSDKEVIQYMVVYADSQDNLTSKVNYYLGLNIGWQLWGTVVFTMSTGYGRTQGWLSQVIVRYKK
jgi:hypothetical protein